MLIRIGPASGGVRWGDR